MSSFQSRKYILVGDVGVGKSTFVNTHLTGEFIKDCNPTSKVSIQSLVFHTKSLKQSNLKNICFNVWDISGHEMFGGIYGCILYAFRLCNCDGGRSIS